MNKLVTALLAGFAFSTQAAELSSFTEVADAVAQGKQLTFVWKIKECTSDQRLPELVSSIKPNAVMVINNSAVTASDRHFTMDNPFLPNQPAFDYTKHFLSADGQAWLRVSVMRASDYTKVKEFQVDCELGKGLQIFD